MKSGFSTSLKIGVLGGGQLGRMLIQEAINLGLELHVMDAPNSPCSKYAAFYTEGSILDYNDVLAFGKNLDILTIEIENVNTKALFELEKLGVKVFPQPHIIELIQDKGLQKKFYSQIDVPSSDYVLVDNKSALISHAAFFPAMLKLRKGGYDGKGVMTLTSEADLKDAFDEPCVLEKFVDLDKELSVIVARNEKGECSVFPIVEQEFNHEANLVEFLFSPADVSAQIQDLASKIAIKIIVELNMVGLLAVEFFLDKKGALCVNEIAPRPHNSGHQTIEGNYTSQFEQHLRTISGLPFGSTDIIQPAVMINLLGEKGAEGLAYYKGLETIMSWKGVYPHIYGKTSTKPFRKMGHITIVNDDLNKAKELALKVKETIKVLGK